jgi:hypothetical protein
MTDLRPRKACLGRDPDEIGNWIFLDLVVELGRRQGDLQNKPGFRETTNNFSTVLEKNE